VAECQNVHHRLGTVVSGADGNAFMVKNGTDIMRVNPIHDEREHAGFFPRRPMMLTPGSLPIPGRVRQNHAMLFDVFRPRSFTYSMAAPRPIVSPDVRRAASNL